MAKGKLHIEAKAKIADDIRKLVEGGRIVFNKPNKTPEWVDPPWDIPVPWSMMFPEDES